MSRALLILLMFAFSAGPLLSADQLLIDPGDASNHLRENVSLSGLVRRLRQQAGNVFLNFGDKYPNQTFTGWVPAGTPLASDPKLKLLEGKTVKITGVIELYHGKPEIRITSKDTPGT